MSIYFLLLSLFSFFSSSDGTPLIIVNNCKFPIWPAILGSSGHQSLAEGGFYLASGRETVIEPPRWWSGRIWARQGCCFDKLGNGTCQTGDCGGQLNCRGVSGSPPATLVEMTLGTRTNPQHYYDVSLVDGFNLPVSMVPLGSSAGRCGVAACEADLNAGCPAGLAVRREGRVVACKSGCLATGKSEYCCTGEYGSRRTCKATSFSRVFKAACPRAYSYAYDEASGLKSCKANRYLIQFCPPI